MTRAVAALFACALIALVPVPVRAVDLPPGQAVFNPFQVLTLNLQLAPADWDTIRRDITDTIEVPAQFWADGEPPILVSVRRKTSRALPSESNPIKVGLKVDINEFVDGQKWHDLNKVSLENGTDSGVLAEGLAWNMHRMASTAEGYGYLSAQAAWVRMVVNGQYIGVYLNAEQRDKQMLKNRGVWVGDKTWLYDQHDMSTIELEEGIGNSATFLALCYSPFSTQSRKNGGCPTPGDTVLTQQLNSLINMQGLLTECAVDALNANDDSLCRHGHNFQFADWAPDVGRKRMYFPWDLDQVFGKTSANIYANGGGRKPSMNQYQDVILRNPTFRAQYNTILRALVSGPLSESQLHAFLDAVEPALIPALETDPYPTVSNGPAAIDGLKAWVSQRLPIVEAQLASNNLPPPR